MDKIFGLLMFLPGKMGKHQRLSIHVQYAEMYQKFILKTDFVKNAENHQMIRLYTKRSFCLISDKKERYTERTNCKMDEIKCTCGKLLARRTESGKILVWCKSCHKEVELEVEPYEPGAKNIQEVKKVRPG